MDVEGAPDDETAGRDVVAADLDPDDAAEENDADDGGPAEQAVSAVQRTSAPVTARLRGDGMKASCPATAFTHRSGDHGKGALGHHLERFGRRQELTVVWTRGEEAAGRRRAAA